MINGKIAPCEMKHLRGNEKYMAALQRVAELGEKMFGLMDDEGKALYEDYTDAHADATAERDLENFAYGFGLCARLIMEAVGGDKKGSSPTS
ncbi:hypothetical protein LJC33_08985 [Eubacteriales bacterium OttesenSCG-928-N13]|nr:hypothetical protein [Eubacteriales bacterium OttesenSCG-928-N13]